LFSPPTAAACDHWTVIRQGNRAQDESFAAKSAREQGDSDAAARLLPLIYDELRLAVPVPLRRWRKPKIPRFKL